MKNEKLFTKSQRRKIKKDLAQEQSRIDRLRKKRRFRKMRQRTKKRRFDLNLKEYKKNRDRKNIRRKENTRDEYKRTKSLGFK